MELIDIVKMRAHIDLCRFTIRAWRGNMWRQHYSATILHPGSNRGRATKHVDGSESSAGAIQPYKFFGACKRQTDLRVPISRLDAYPIKAYSSECGISVPALKYVSPLSYASAVRMNWLG